jgi:hypothetical protein
MSNLSINPSTVALGPQYTVQYQPGYYASRDVTVHNKAIGTVGSKSLIVDNAANLSVGDLVEAYGIPEQTTISTISGSTLTLSSAITQTIPIGTALYIGSISKPSSCILPSAISPTLDLGSPIAPIDLSCHYAFPQVYLTPPIYNAPQTFVACEDFSATVDISLRNAITGSITASSTSSPHCGLAITGLLDVNTCSDFTATSNITFSGAAKNSALKLTARGQPDCGVDISGNIDVQACSAFTSTVKFNVPDAMAGSVFSVTPKGPSDCGLDLDLALKLNLNACEKITPIINFTFPEAMAGSTATFSASQNPPDCPIQLDLNLALNACTTFTAGGGISVGGGGASGFVGLRTNQLPDCGVFLAGNITVPAACTGITAGGNVSFTGAARGSLSLSPTGGAPGCGIQLNGSVNVQCPTANSSFRPRGPVEGEIRLTSTGGASCGINLEGDLKIKACKTFSIDTSSYQFLHLAGINKPTFAISPVSPPDESGFCPLKLTGTMDIPCPSILTTDITWGGLVNSSLTTLNITIPDAKNCNQLKLKGSVAFEGAWTNVTICNNGSTSTMQVWARALSTTH